MELKQSPTQYDNRNKITGEILKQKISEKLSTRGICDPKNATQEQLYHAVVYAMKDMILEARAKYKKNMKAVDAKRVCYLCMEFLVGRSLKNYAVNLGIYDMLCALLKEFGSSFEQIYACEVDPGLGNGGLGRLAACFMDSLSACDFAANGYSLLYENGLFKQRIVDGEQVELPDEWLPAGGAWFVVHPEKSITVRLGGRIEEAWENGGLKITHVDYQEVKAVPYDMMIPGTVSGAVNTIRFWRARAPYMALSDHEVSQSSYVQRMSATEEAEIITKQLYPPDNYDEGKLLRLSQQYFLVSASLQSIIHRAFINDRGINLFALFCCQVHHFKFVHISAAAYTAEIAGIGQFFCDQIDDEFAFFLDDVIGMAAGADRNVSHGRVRVDGACPCHCDDVFVFHIAAGYHYGRNGINDCPGFPDIFSHLNFSFHGSFLF